jgi:hypothetical protein
MNSHKVDWQTFKAFVTARNLSIQWISVNSCYHLNAIDGPFSLQCEIPQDGSQSGNQSDFETNYKTAGNASFSDIDGTPLARQKASKKGWSFWAVPIEITTSTLGGSLYCKDVSGTDIPGMTCKIYDSNDAEITSGGLAGINLTQCVKTVLDFEPAFDYEMIGGTLRINSNPGSDIRLWIIGAPDIPAIYGGSKEFASGVNLKFLSADNAFEIDGRVTKYVTYSATTHSGKLRIVLKHPAGTNLNLQAVIHTYKA